MAEIEQAGDRTDPRGLREDAGEEPPAAGAEAAAAQARAYLDLWERNLVHSAVRGRHGPPAGADRRAAAGLMGEIAPHRVGEPSPLIFHLSMALSAYGQALMMAPRADSPSFPWVTGLRPEPGALAGLDHTEVAAEIVVRLQATLRASTCGRRTRSGAASATRRRSGRTAAPGSATSGRRRGGAAGRAADPRGAEPDQPALHPRPGTRALAAALAGGAGLPPAPRGLGRARAGRGGFDLDSLWRAAAGAGALGSPRDRGRPVPVIGYCMGGTLAVGSRRGCLRTWAPSSPSARPGISPRTRDRRGVALAHPRRGGPTGRDAARVHGRGVRARARDLPPDALRARQSDAGSDEVPEARPPRPARTGGRLFVALEDWLADGVPMPAGAARDLLVGWQVRNLTGTGDWAFLGDRVIRGQIRAPALVVCGETDSIAPPSLARPLARGAARGGLLVARTGHVGMIVGGVARAAVWRPLADFLRTHCS